MSRCRCELLTEGGWYDPHGWCYIHACPGCGHAPHGHPEWEGCSTPDPRTGWCECERGWWGDFPRQILHKGRKASKKVRENRKRRWKA